MRKVCLLISFAVAASGAVADPSASVFWGPVYAFPVQQRHGLIAAEDIPPPLVTQTQARACFKRSTAEELIRSSGQLPAAALQTLSPYGFLYAWTRSTCSLDVNFV